MQRLCAGGSPSVKLHLLLAAAEYKAASLPIRPKTLRPTAVLLALSPIKTFRTMKAHATQMTAMRDGKPAAVGHKLHEPTIRSRHN